MKIKVRTFGELSRIIGNEILEDLGDDATIEDLVSEIAKRSGTNIRDRGGVYEFAEHQLAILINGRNIDTLKGGTRLKNGDLVVILSPFIGG